MKRIVFIIIFFIIPIISYAGTTVHMVHPATVKYIAASNSSASDKAAADVVCDGTDDQADFNSLISTMTSGGIIRPFKGTYNFDTLTVDPNWSGHYYAIGFPESLASTQGRCWTIEYPGRTNDLVNYWSTPDVTFNITTTAMGKLGGSDYAHGILACKGSATGYTGVYIDGNNIIIKGVYVQFPTNQRNYVYGIDLRWANQATVEDCIAGFATAWASQAVTTGTAGNHAGFVTPIAQCEFNTFRRCFSATWAVAYDVPGEHNLFENCIAYRSKYPWYLGTGTAADYGTHDLSFSNTLMQCQELMCINGIYINSDGITAGAIPPKLNLISYSIERNSSGTWQRSSEAVEATDNSMCGTIDYTTYTNGGTGFEDVDFFASGGSSFTKIRGGEIYVPKSNTARAGINIPSGTAPTSPRVGDLYPDGTHLYYKPSGDAVDLLASGGTTNTYYVLLSETNKQSSVYAAGTAYNLTDTSALLDFGTTDPTITLNYTGTYRLQGRARLDYAAAQCAASKTATLKLRKTSGTAADVSNSSTSLTTGVLGSALTQTWMIVDLPPVYYDATSGDVISMFGGLSASLDSGNIAASEACITTEYYGNYTAYTLNYIQRVEADGGVVISPDDVDSAYKFLSDNSLMSSCVQWISPQFGVKKDESGNVSKMYDLISGNNDFNSTTYPVWTANQQNGKAALVFNGSDDYMTGGNPTSLRTSGSWFMVACGNSSVVQFHRILSYATHTAASENPAISVDVSATATLHYRYNTVEVNGTGYALGQSTVDANTSTYHLLDFTYDSNWLITYGNVDNAGVSISQSSNASGSPTLMTLGAKTYSTSTHSLYWLGSIADVACFTALSTGNQDLVQAFLNTKFDLYE